MSVNIGPRAVMAHSFGTPRDFVLEPHDPGPPGPQHVRIAVRAAGISFVDVLVAAGRYQLRPPLPFIPGSEFSGVVEAVGPEVDPGLLGRRVCAAGFGMAFCEAAVVPVGLVSPIPDDMSFADAATFRVSYATAYYALAQRGFLQPGETLLVLGAGGAVGYAAIQIGKALGATVIASASTPEKRTLAQAGGADHVIDARAADWRAELRAAQGKRGIDVVIDPVGGGATELAFRSLAWGGRLLVIGFAGGEIAKLPVNLALLKGAALIGVDIRQMGQIEPERASANLQALFTLYRDGHLRPAIAKTYRLDDFADAMEAAYSGLLAGRVVLLMGEDAVA